MKISLLKLANNFATATDLKYVINNKLTEIDFNNIIIVKTDYEFDFFKWYNEEVEYLGIKKIILDNEKTKVVEFEKNRISKYIDGNEITKYKYYKENLILIKNNNYYIRYIYDNLNRLKKIKNDKNQIIKYEYKNNKLIRIISDDSIIKYKYGYDHRGYKRITELYDDKFYVTKYFNKKGKLIWVYDATGFQEKFTYNKDGNISEYKNSKNEYIIYDYNFQNELKKIFTNIAYKKIKSTICVK